MARYEGARKTGQAIVVCTTPDVCKTPMGNSTPPVPYQITANFSDSTSVSPNVRFGGDPAFILDQSIITRVTGDEPGTAGGVKSGTNVNIVEPVEASKNVKANKKRVVRHNDACRMNNGNTMGRVVYQSGGGEGEISVRPETAEEAGKAVEKKGLWSKMSGVVHGALDVAGFIPGLGAVPDLVNAGIYALEGNTVEAGISAVAAIPGFGDAVKGGALVVKGGKAVAKKVAKEAAEKAAKEAAEKAAKEAAEKAAKDKAKKEAAEKAAKKQGKENVHVKKKKKLKCGEHGKYKDQKKKTGEGKFDRDHVPSKAALKKRAQSLLRPGEKLNPKQQKAIEDMADTIAIPRQAHRDVSPTFGNRNSPSQIANDSGDLAGAARRDINEMLGKIDEYDVDGRCKKAYKRAAKKVMKMTNDDFDKFLKEIIKKNR